MPNKQPVISDAKGGRRFACSAAAVLAFVIDERERVLVLSSPGKRGVRGTWEVINGALEAEETILEAVLRETREEGGEALRVRPLGAIHAYTWRYDEDVQYMIDVCYLLAYEGGEVVPGDDMAGCEARWVSVEEVESGAVEILIPSEYPWLFRRAVEMYRLLAPRPAVELQHG